MTSMSWGNDAGGNDSDPTKKAAHEGAPVASVKKRPSKMPVIEIGHLLAERRQHQSRQPAWPASFEPDEGGSEQQMAAKLPAGLLGAVPESVGSMKRQAESSNSIEATPKRVIGITQPAHSFGSCGSPLAELGNGVENIGSRKNEQHMEQSIAHLPSQSPAPAARTAALSFLQDECASIECGAVMSVCSKGRGRVTVHDIPTVPNSGRLQLSGDAPQQETEITEEGTTSCCAAALNTLRSIRDKEPPESQRDLVSANEAPEALLSKKRDGAKRIAGQLIESPALAKVTCEREVLKIGELAHSQHDYSKSAQFHGNKIAAVTTSPATSMNRCVPLEELISSSAMEHAGDASLPAFSHFVNFPGYIRKQRRDGKRRCVMCGTSCLVVRSGRSESLEPIMIYSHNGVCKACGELFWKVSDKDLVVKFCYQCSKFQQWAVFGVKGRLKICEWCRVSSSRRKEHTEQLTESVGPMKRQAESSNSVGATPKRVKGITHPSHSFGSHGSPLAKLGNGVENIGSRKNEQHVERSIAHLPSQSPAPTARTAALPFLQDVCDSIECGAMRKFQIKTLLSSFAINAVNFNNGWFLEKRED